MPNSPFSDLTRLAALTLILLLQSAHYITQLRSLWTRPPQPSGGFLPAWLSNVADSMTITAELWFFVTTGYGFVQRKRDFRFFRGRVIRGRGIDALLWATLGWSAVVVWNDAQQRAGINWWCVGQLLGVGGIVSVDVLCKNRYGDWGWVERRDGVEQGAGGRGEGGREVDEKMDM